VSNAGSNNISGYSIGASSGTLTALGGSPFAVSPFMPDNIPISPLAIHPSGKFAYVSCQVCALTGFSIDSASGGLTALGSPPGSPLSGGGQIMSQSFVTTSSGEYVQSDPQCAETRTLPPIGHAIPVPFNPQYPSGFFARYCWW
jgi:hypothetical protein